MLVRHKGILATFAILALTGCGHPHASPGPDVELPDGYVDSIVLQNGDELVFDWFGYGHWEANTTKNAHVEGDHVVGYADGQRTEIRLADIQDIQYRRPAWIGTLLFTLVLVAPVVLLGLLYGGSYGD